MSISFPVITWLIPSRQLGRRAAAKVPQPDFQVKGSPEGRQPNICEWQRRDGGAEDDTESLSGAGSDHEQENSQDNQVQQTVRAG